MKRPNTAQYYSFLGTQLVLPYSEDRPALSPKQLRIRYVASLVAPELGKPVADIAIRTTPMFSASVPEASVYEYRQLCFWEHKIRISKSLRMASPAADCVASQDCRESHFCVPIATRSDCSHDLGSFSSGKDICHVVSLPSSGTIRHLHCSFCSFRGDPRADLRSCLSLRHLRPVWNAFPFGCPRRARRTSRQSLLLRTRAYAPLWHCPVMEPILQADLSVRVPVMLESRVPISFESPRLTAYKAGA
jgi:hypothetical protein